MQKIRKVLCNDFFFSNLKNLILGPLWVYFGPETSKKILPQKSCGHQFFIKLEKPHFGTILAPFGSKRCCDFFQKIRQIPHRFHIRFFGKYLAPSLKLNDTLTSCKNKFFEKFGE